MVVLYNPTRSRSRRGSRRVDDARDAWSEFHEAPRSKSRSIEIEDVDGLPKTVMSLGVCEGFELVDDASLSARAQVVTFKRSRSSRTQGPWLVTNTKMDTLWILARHDRRRDQSLLRKADGMIMRAIYYWPPDNSGKHDPQRAFRHEFGETGEGGRPKREWPRYYPECELLGPQALEIIRPRNGYTVEDRGIVG